MRGQLAHLRVLVPAVQDVDVLVREHAIPEHAQVIEVAGRAHFFEQHAQRMSAEDTVMREPERSPLSFQRSARIPWVLRVTPAQTGVQRMCRARFWIPAGAGMTSVLAYLRLLSVGMPHAAQNAQPSR